MAKFFVDDYQDLTLLLNKTDLENAKKSQNSSSAYVAESEKDIIAFYAVNSSDKRFKKEHELSLGNKLLVWENRGRIVYHISISTQTCEKLKRGEGCSERYLGGSKLLIKLEED